MSRRILLPAAADLPAFLAEFLPPGPDLSGWTVVFPHGRPRHTLNRLLAKREGGPFFPPAYLTLPCLQEEVLRARCPELTLVAPLDALDLMMDLLEGESAGELARLKGRPALAWAWAGRLVEAVGELDDAMIPADRPLLPVLPDLPAASKLGEEVLDRLSALRRGFHAALEKRRLYTRGMAAWRVAEAAREPGFTMERDMVVVFPESLTRSEEILIRALDKWDGTTLIAHGAVPEALENLPFEPMGGECPATAPAFHSAFDTHSEIEALRGLMAAVPPEELERSAVILLKEEALVPLLEHVLAGLGVEYNISLGYPFKRTPLYALVRGLLDLQSGRRGGLYPAPLYLEVFLHPYLKNLGSGPLDASGARILAQTVDEYLAEQGKLHFDPYALATHRRLVEGAVRRLAGMAGEADLAAHWEFLHGTFLRPLETAHSLRELTAALRAALAALAGGGGAAGYAFSGEFFHTLAGFLDEVECSSLADRPLGAPFLYELFASLMGESRVAFTGLPMQGLQVLGLLEARHLPFDHVFVLDANEGVLPSLVLEDSLLPLPVRRRLGLPGPEQRQAAAALRLDRLMAGCRSAQVLFREGEEEMPSRFILRRLWDRERKGERPLDGPKGKPVVLGLRLDPLPPLVISKSPEVARALREREWSPSSLDAYLACPLRFYYGKVLGLEEREVLEEGFDAGTAGLILHRALQLLYEPRVGRPLDGGAYAAMTGAIGSCLDRAFDEKGWEKRGEAYLVHRLMARRIERFLKEEAEIEGLAPERLEWDVRGDSNGWRFKGILDRLDRRSDGGLRILDYKSGTARPFIKRPDGPLIGREACKGRVESFQMPVYAVLARGAAGAAYAAMEVVTVSLRKFERTALFKGVADPDRWMEGTALPTIVAFLEEIADPSVPFTADPLEDRTCRTCPFGALCPKGGGV